MKLSLPQRQCVFLNGEPSQWLAPLDTFIADQKATAIAVADLPFEHVTAITHKQAQQQLGKEYSIIIFDATAEIHPDSLGAMIGTLTAGGVLFVLLNQVRSHYQQRFQQIARQMVQQSAYFYWCDSANDLAEIPLTIFKVNAYSQTEDQQQAIAAVKKVATGHRKRPLVLSSDRGRGKSAALGIAAAQLLALGKKKIIVTAPSLATLNSFFKHALQTVSDADYSKGMMRLADGEIRFIAPDKLVETLPAADLVIIDEAAAIPSFMLEKILQNYSRLVFATTLHGYEGTGRGFALRFQQAIEQRMPQWQALTIKTPIRWAEDDQLEPFSFNALLLDAAPVEDGLVDKANSENIIFSQLSQAELANNEQQLRQLFGLMALAHYRTRPNDVKILLDRDDVSIYSLQYHGHIVATAWLIEEGGLDDDLSAAIYQGRRRPNGHLLPQSLLAHSGIANAGHYRYQRIARIVVHPVLQRQGLGRYLIEKIAAIYQENSDCLGASFAADEGVLQFWLRAGFQPVRLGFHKDEVSGNHAVMVLKASSQQGQRLIEQNLLRLQQQWPFLLQHQYKQVDSNLLIMISRQLQFKSSRLNNDELAEIFAFAHAQRSYEASQYCLWKWALVVVSSDAFYQLTASKQGLIMRFLLQQQGITELVAAFCFSGRKQLMAELRQAVSLLLD